MSAACEFLDSLRNRSPLSVADYMRAAADRYYATRDPFGAEGDFITAPEISQIFGELIGAWLAQMWRQAGAPGDCLLCELGPGRGTLMKDALRATRKVEGFHDALRLIMVETSPFLHKAQRQSLIGAHPRLQWQETPDSLPALPLFLVANEFFDALPIHQYVATAQGRQERMVRSTPNGLEWSSQGEVIREISPESQAVIARIASHIRRHGGAALVIDYGYASETHGDTLQALHRHQCVHPLKTPGEADITAHVDFRTLMQTANTAGACAWGIETQGTFLKRLGAELRAQALCRHLPAVRQNIILSGLERIVAPQQMGELFKVMAITSSLDKPPGF